MQFSTALLISVSAALVAADSGLTDCYYDSYAVQHCVDASGVTGVIIPSPQTDAGVSSYSVCYYKSAADKTICIDDDGDKIVFYPGTDMEESAKTISTNTYEEAYNTASSATTTSSAAEATSSSGAAVASSTASAAVSSSAVSAAASSGTASSSAAAASSSASVVEANGAAKAITPILSVLGALVAFCI
ncbi:hypothetical protein CLIB1423_15S03532 [[Candida] railenensis]|uniref:Cell wall protein n=1 Tax=[Candida] railenensis TaxID=45579 RepID=A0A9P0QSV2_9ASCO|nr:hypothetical protein CLIB1423_15S03532 [[Candida] railenensis]